jgi:hypothetical protein
VRYQDCFRLRAPDVCAHRVFEDDAHQLRQAAALSLGALLSVKDGRTVRSDSGTEYEVGALREMDLTKLPSSTIKSLEPAILAGVALQASAPHRSTLPKDGALVKRIVPDEADRKVTHWHGRSSFVKQFAAPVRHVARIVDPVKRQVLWGAPFPQAPGR